MCLAPSNPKGIASSSPGDCEPTSHPAKNNVEVVASFILKGWKSLSPGLRGTSYPGVGGPLNLNPERVLSKALNRYLEERAGERRPLMLRPLMQWRCPEG